MDEKQIYITMSNYKADRIYNEHLEHYTGEATLYKLFANFKRTVEAVEDTPTILKKYIDLLREFVLDEIECNSTLPEIHKPRLKQLTATLNVKAYNSDSEAWWNNLFIFIHEPMIIKFMDFFND